MFSKFQERKKELVAKGVDVIDLGIGAPDLPPPQFVIDQLIQELSIAKNHRYPPFGGVQAFKEAVAEFYERTYGVTLNPHTEVLALIGSKEGLHHLMQTIINPGDCVIVPDPGYPVYASSIHLAGGRQVHLPLNMKEGGRPDYSSLGEDVLQRAKLLILNYPNNPTTATIQVEDFVEALTFTRKNNLFIAHDAAYSLMTFGDYHAPSVLQVDNAKEVAVEFGSLSKSFNMTGWRIGYVVGNAHVIKALASLKSNIDSSQFVPIQLAAARALTSNLQVAQENSDIFKQRMEMMFKGLKHLGYHVEKPRGTIFMWVKVPHPYTSKEFAKILLEHVGVIVTPGSAFGSKGEGYIRIALTTHTTRLSEALERFQELQEKG